MKQYIQKVNFGDENPSYDIRGNIVNIIFGLNLPLIYPYLYNMMNFASTLSNKYIDYEKKIREKSTENEEFDFKKMQGQFNINNIFGKTSQNISKQEMDLFYQDFIRIFIFENMRQINDLEQILKIILEIKFGKDLDTYDKVGEVILWVKSYSNFIIDILKFCEELKFNLEIFKFYN